MLTLGYWLCVYPPVQVVKVHSPLPILICFLGEINYNLANVAVCSLPKVLLQCYCCIILDLPVYYSLSWDIYCHCSVILSNLFQYLIYLQLPFTYLYTWFYYVHALLCDLNIVLSCILQNAFHDWMIKLLLYAQPRYIFLDKLCGLSFLRWCYKEWCIIYQNNITNKYHLSCQPCRMSDIHLPYDVSPNMNTSASVECFKVNATKVLFLSALSANCSATYQRNK